MEVDITIFRTKFFARLQSKTGWGRVEVEAEFERALTDTLAEMLRHLKAGKD